MEAAVEVFKTNVQKARLARELSVVLHSHFPDYKINFDLQDCDRILRVEGHDISVQKITEVVTTLGFQCKVLE